MVEVRQSNPEAFATLDLRLKELQGWEGRTGWFESAQYPDGTPVAYIAAIQELGSGPIPPRPFLRPAEKKYAEQWKALAAHNAEMIIEGKMTGQQAMQALADVGAAHVAQSIEDVSSPALSLITLWARYYKRVLGRKITGSTIGEIAGKIKSGELSGKPDVNDDPLKDTGLMISSVSGIAVKE